MSLCSALTMISQVRLVEWMMFISLIAASVSGFGIVNWIKLKRELLFDLTHLASCAWCWLYKNFCTCSIWLLVFSFIIWMGLNLNFGQSPKRPWWLWNCKRYVSALILLELGWLPQLQSWDIHLMWLRGWSAGGLHATNVMCRWSSIEHLLMVLC